MARRRRKLETFTLSKRPKSSDHAKKGEVRGEKVAGEFGWIVGERACNGGRGRSARKFLTSLNLGTGPRRLNLANTNRKARRLITCARGILGPQ